MPRHLHSVGAASPCDHRPRTDWTVHRSRRSSLRHGGRADASLIYVGDSPAAGPRPGRGAFARMTMPARSGWHPAGIASCGDVPRSVGPAPTRCRLHPGKHAAFDDRITRQGGWSRAPLETQDIARRGPETLCRRDGTRVRRCTSASATLLQCRRWRLRAPCGRTLMTASGRRSTPFLAFVAEGLVCRPGSVPGRLATHRSATIHLGPPLPTASCGPPAHSGGQPSSVRCSTLLRAGFTEPIRSPGSLVVSCTTVSPLPDPR